MKDGLSDKFMLVFDPALWSAARRFQTFAGPPFTHHEAVRGAEASMHHLEKFQIIANVANRLGNTLEEDERELDQEGYTPARRSKEFAALVEVLACELYAVLDGVRRGLYGAFPGVRGIPEKSNSKLFQHATDKAFGPEFPENIRAALDEANVTWFKNLRRLRGEVTHGSTGSCILNRETDTISYVHNRLGTAQSTLIETDIVGSLNDYAVKVLHLVETVFSHLYALLERKEHLVLCGVFLGRMYQRIVVAGENLTRGSGVCLSRQWFESEPGLECPLRHQCPAFSGPRQ
jgi:hypothetical protein